MQCLKFQFIHWEKICFILKQNNLSTQLANIKGRFTLKEKIEKYVSDVIAIPKIEDAVKYTLENAQDDDIIISAGSLYMIGHVRQLVK